jgi:hypothetical protein
VVYDFPKGVRVYAFCRTIDNCYGENASLIPGSKGRCDLLQLRITGETKMDASDLEHAALFNAIRTGKPANNGDYMVRSTTSRSRLEALRGARSSEDGELKLATAR